MFNNKRKRAVVLALIAFFCGATSYVAVDWKRFGGGFLAFFKPKSEPVLAYAGGGAPSGGAILTATSESHPSPGPQLALAAPSARQHSSNVGGGSGGRKGDDDLFKYGDPAAGMAPGSFVVAQNDTPAGNAGAGAAPSVPVLSAAPETSVGAPSGGDAGGGGGGVSSPAPAPGGGNDSGDGGIIVKTPSPSPSPATPTPPAPPPVVSTPVPAAPAPTPTQSGTSDPGNGGGDTPPPPPPPIVITTPPVSAVPEASNAAMMGLGALFLAVAATRRRKNGQD